MRKNKLAKLNIEVAKKNLINFCESDGYLYLYGAGYWGGKLYELIRNWGYDVKGFVVTQSDERKNYYDLPIIEAKNLINQSAENDTINIIMAFENPDSSYYREMFSEKRFALYFMSVDIMSELVNEQGYNHLLELLNLEHGLTIKKRETENIKLLLIRLDVIGDLVCTTATVREIRHNFPEANITLVINSKFIGLFEESPYIDELVGYDCHLDVNGLYERLSDADKDAERVKQFIHQHKFQEKKFDMVFLPRALMTGSSCIEELMLAVFCNCGERIGHMIDMHSSDFEEEQYHFLKEYFTLLPLQHNECHETDYQLDMLEKKGLIVSNRKNELWVSESSLNEAKNLLKVHLLNKKCKLIALGIVGSKAVKNWDKELFCDFIQKVNNIFCNKYCFLIMGGADAADTAKYIVSKTDNCIDFTGKTNIKVSVALIKCCEIYVGIDTGLMHIADALGKPSIALYHSLPDRHGVTSYGPVRWGAHTKHSIIIEPQKGIDGCSMYCRKEYAHCINTISPDLVFSKFKGLIYELEKEIGIG